MKSTVMTKVTFKAVIIRSCVRCGGVRTLGTPCADCGNPDPPVIQDAGIQSAYYRNIWKNLAWNTVGRYLASRRARNINKGVCG